MTKIKDVLAKAFDDKEHKMIAVMLGQEKTVPAVFDRLVLLNKQDHFTIGLFQKMFNAKDLKGLAGELLEYYQNHPEKIDHFKDAAKHKIKDI